ncbi:MAG: phosphate/phosphite/phosphonate ABC transporter substrate-binding protein [Chloroflexota bacterium]
MTRSNDLLHEALQRRATRRRVLRGGLGLAGAGMLAAGFGVFGQTPGIARAQYNTYGWPTSVPTLSMGFIPLEDAVQQRSRLKVFSDFISERIGVGNEVAITTSYAALVEAQRNKQTVTGYYGALSFLLAEQQFGAVPIMVDSADGVTPGSYNSLLLAGKDSPVQSVQDVRGQDFSFVDPASTSGNLFPRVMLIEEGMDPNRDVRGRYAGNHQNSILAIANGQVPCGASNNISVDSAIRNGVIAPDALRILKISDPIPNGPFAVHPDLDPQAVSLLQSAMGQFLDRDILKGMELQGPLIPVETSAYNFVRRAATAINLQFDEKGKAIF